MDKIHTIIKDLRKLNNMTLKEVGNRLGVTEATVQRYESGLVKSIPYDKIIAYSELFGVNPTYLITGVEEEKPVSEPLPRFNEDDIEIMEMIYKLNEEQKKSLKTILASMIG